MKPTRIDKKLPILFLFALLISLSACVGAKNIQGKWEADFSSKRSGSPGSKVIFEFLPDGTFNAMPAGDTTIVDKDKYQLLDDGHTLKMRSQLFGGDALCKYTGSAIHCETETANIDFKRL
ncbi:MAG TPA: hypothetical protein VFS90_18970 [Pyrinomonadaceae bacterium]|nr:hypothetical protein [Pyrinomonadaceae bacterium]